MGRGLDEDEEGEEGSLRVAGEETNHRGEKSIDRFVKIVEENENAY